MSPLQTPRQHDQEAAASPCSSATTNKPARRRVFGWQFQAYEGQDYHLTFEAGGAIANAPEQKYPPIHFGTDDLDAAIGRVRELGGQADEKQEVPGFGHYTYCSDTEGNRFGLYQPGGGE